MSCLDSKSYSSESEGAYTPRKMSHPPPIKSALTPRSKSKQSRDSSNQSPRKSRETRPNGEQSKPWSPTMSSPDLQQLLKLEEKKLKVGGYMEDPPRMMSPNKSLSLPSLNDVDAAPFHDKTSRGHHGKQLYYIVNV